MNKKPVETIMGIVVLVVATLFMFFAYRVSDLQVVKGYELNARFLKVGGLNVGADVRINGIKIGTVVAQKINSLDYMVDVKLSILPTAFICPVTKGKTNAIHKNIPAYTNRFVFVIILLHYYGNPVWNNRYTALWFL